MKGIKKKKEKRKKENPIPRKKRALRVAWKIIFSSWVIWVGEFFFSPLFEVGKRSLCKYLFKRLDEAGEYEKNIKAKEKNKSSGTRIDLIYILDY